MRYAVPITIHKTASAVAWVEVEVSEAVDEETALALAEARALDALETFVADDNAWTIIGDLDFDDPPTIRVGQVEDGIQPAYFDADPTQENGEWPVHIHLDTTKETAQ